MPLLLAIAVERAAFIAPVSWDALREKLGARFLPLALGWLLLAVLGEATAEFKVWLATPWHELKPDAPETVFQTLREMPHEREGGAASVERLDGVRAARALTTRYHCARILFVARA